MTKRADILSLLKEEKDFLEKQLKKVATAIAAFSDEEKVTGSKPGRKRGPKPRKTTAAGKATTTGKKRGRKPKSTTPASGETAGSETTLGSSELG
jgi:hypothetical protein